MDGNEPIRRNFKEKGPPTQSRRPFRPHLEETSRPRRTPYARHDETSENRDWKKADCTQKPHFTKQNNGPSTKQSHRPAGFGYRRLQALSKQQDLQIMEIFTNEQTLAEFTSLCSQSDLKDDFLVCIMVILGKLSRAEFSQLVVQSLSQISSSIFINQLLCYIVKYDEEIEESAHQEALDFFDSVAAYCHTVTKLLPTLACEKLLPVVKQCCSLLDKTLFDGVDKVKEVLSITMERIMAEKEKRKSQTVKKTVQEEALQLQLPPENFRELSTIPMAADLLQHIKSAFLRPGLIEGPYNDVEHYLDVQFRLMREDFIRPLRDGIREFISKKNEIKDPQQKGRRIKVNNIKIYQEVLIEKPEIVEDKVGFFLRFDCKKKFCTSINWDQSKRFMIGSLLILSKDDFQSIVLAMVLRREAKDLSEGRILIEILGDANHGNTSYSRTWWTMAESQLFFGAYSHVLDALKSFDEVNFPLKDYIVRGRNEGKMPLYLERAPDPRYLLPHPPVPKDKEKDEDGEEEKNDAEAPLMEMNPRDDATWPTANDVGLDESQYEAFKGALTQTLMLVQGPPGTGKTYLGLRIASVLLKNSDYWQKSESMSVCFRPLVVVCYTNHALDQFLMGLTPFTSSIVRVGGGSKEKSLEKYSLKNLRGNPHLYHRGRNLSDMLWTFRTNFRTLKEKYESIEKVKISIEGGGGIVDPECLFNYEVISEKQIYSFESRNDFMRWLEGGFSMRAPPKGMERDLTEKIYGDPNDEDGSRDVNYLVDFQRIESASFKSSETLLRNYLHQRKVYLETQLRSPNTKPEDLDMGMVDKLRSLKQLPVEKRWQLYRFWVSELLKYFTKRLDNLQPDLLKAAADLKQARMVEEQDVMSTCKVIGMTTSYAASRQQILKQLRPRIVIVEEAAEVLESHVLVSLTGSVEHLIMIGDHLQLKPNPAVYELGTKYHLNLSLFERLINNKVQCVSLTTQHRMRREIAELVSPTIYPSLINHDSVLRYPQVKGVTKNLVFINHQHHQEHVEEIQSFRNVHEAEFLVALVRYLILQGYQPSQITVLTTYKGQMFHLLKLRQDNALLKDVRITVVDNYQGEENDLILLSLVRSNDDANVGFLKIENRVCVALSRAKLGLFIIGNMDNLVSKGDIWPKVTKVLQKQDALVEALELRCEVHSVITPVSCGDDFKKTPEGGCLRQCGTLMPCGHTCVQLCHGLDRDHLNFKCFEPCARPLCVQNHICPDKCYEKCSPCMVPKDVTLPCQHSTSIPCHVEPSQYNCLEVIPFILVCNHTKNVRCFETKNPHKIQCIKPCTVRLDCGHACERRCHVLDDPDHETYKCTKLCGHTNVGCSTGDHLCKKACHQDCDDCVIMIEKELPCGHKWTMKCHEEPSRLLCGNKCSLTNDCGHRCRKTCREPCSPCQTEVPKIIPQCKHEQMMPCGNDPALFNTCKAKCDLKLFCGHNCTKLCHEDCVEECQEMVPYPKPTICGHKILVPCFKKDKLDSNSDELLMLCREPCGVPLIPCDHRCKGTCGTCWQGQLHQACKEPCGRVLVCGHSCKAPCASTCPPCSAPCLVKCGHSACPNKCGMPCAPCKEPCLRKCPHKKCNRDCGKKCSISACSNRCGKTVPKCKHKCIGLCGDICICEECNENIREVFFGTEDGEEARFIMLPDCKHIFETTGLEQWLLQGDEFKESGRIVVKEKVCPRCNTSIRTCMRYSDIILKHANDVQEVKWKVYGNLNIITDTAENALAILNIYIPDIPECHKLTNKISSDLWAVRKARKNRKVWYRPPFSLGEIKNLKEYSTILATLATVASDACGLSKVAREFKARSVSWRLEELKAASMTDPGYHLNTKCRDEVIYFVTKIARNLLNRHVVRLSGQEAKDINAVLKKLNMLFQLCVIESSPNFSILDSSSKEVSKNISLKVRGCHRYSDSEFSEDSKILRELAEKVKVRISKEEIRSVVAAMRMTQGHWFKCPNGHVYAIGDCGGATVESQCNECGAKIGGANHRLRSDNSLAREIDGASRPAWPGSTMG